MTLSVENGETVARVSIRVDRNLDEWVQALVANGDFDTVSDVWREGARRVISRPAVLLAASRPWRPGMTYDRHHFRLPRQIAQQVNRLEEDGWELDTAEILRVGAAIVAEEHLESASVT